MNLLLLTSYFSVLLTRSYCNVLWDASVQTLLNLFKREDILKLNLTRKCTWQIELLYEHGDIALQMFDASAKLPYAGMLDSGRTELGNFDECVSIDYTFNDVNILGKYCYAGFVIPDGTNLSNFDTYFKLATCTPDACTADDLLKIADHVIPDFPPLFLDNFCTTKATGKEITIGTIASSFVFFLIIFLVLLGTVYDIYCHKTGKKALLPLLVAFSVITNTKKIVQVNSNTSRETINVFNGFRTVSIVWIIAGHGSQSFTTMIIPAINNDDNIARLYKRYSSYLFAANYAVTTFFYMSGFLLSYLYFKRSIRPWKVQLKSLPLLYLHRYIRLTAPMFLLYIALLYLMKHFGSGPLWHSGCQNEIDICRKYWWSFFLYLQNYANYDEMCLVPLWYLSADMQLFILAPLILIPVSIILKSHGLKIAMLTLAGVNVVFLLLPIGFKLLFPKIADNTFATHDRLTDYFVGLMMGIFMRFSKDEPFLGTIKTRYTSKINLLMWIIVLSGMFSAFLFYEDAEMWFDHTNKTVYFGFTRIIWVAGLSWIVYSCYHGYGGFVNWILCRPIFEVGGKLSYSMYLLHYIVLGHFTYSNRIKYYVDEYIQFYIFCGYLIETLFWSFLWTLAFESPILMIEKYFFANEKHSTIKPHNHKKTEESQA